MLPRRAPPRGNLLYSPTKISVSYDSPQRYPLRGPQSSPTTNNRVISRSDQPVWRGPIRPCPLRSIGRDKSQLMMMISMTMTKAMLTGVTVPVEGNPGYITLTGPRGLLFIFHGVICLLPFLWDKFSKNKISRYFNYTVFLLSDNAIVCYL